MTVLAVETAARDKQIWQPPAIEVMSLDESEGVIKTQTGPESDLAGPS